MGKTYTLKFEYEMDIVLDSVDMDCVIDSEEYAKELMIEELRFLFDKEQYSMTEYINTIDVNSITDKEIRESYI